MRPITNFALHALLAAALAAVAATSAAAGAADGGEPFVRLAGGTGTAGEQIAIRSFQWGPDAAEEDAGDLTPIKSRYFDEWTVEVEGPEGEEGSQSAPAAQGSLLVTVNTAWPACRVGARYPALELADGARTYRLGDVTISSCGGTAAPGRSITFAYGKLG